MTTPGVLVRLCPGCTAEGEVDNGIDLLSAEPDTVAERMKQAIRERFDQA
jgi:hypothetical protein